MGEWIGPGAHVNAVGSRVAFTRELDTAAVVKSRLFVDRRESTLNEAGDFLFPKKEGAIGDDHIQGEIGEILLGKVKGRESADEITLFKSLGLAVEDLASAYHVYKKALEKGAVRQQLLLIAQSAGVSEEGFNACITDPAAAKRIDVIQGDAVVRIGDFFCQPLQSGIGILPAVVQRLFEPFS